MSLRERVLVAGAAVDDKDSYSDTATLDGDVRPRRSWLTCKTS